MSQVIAYNQNGFATIIIPSPKSSVEANIKHVPDGVDYTVLDQSDLPRDRKWRDAWIVADGAIEIDMQRASRLFMQRIRIMRNREMEKLDREQLILQSKSKPIDAVADKKHVLRDLPKTINTAFAKTVQELEALWPAILPEFTGE